MSKHFRAAFFFQMYLFVRLTVVKPRGQCVLKQLGLMTHQSITTQSFYRQKDPEGISPPKFLFFLPSFPSNQLEHLSRNKGKRYDRHDYRYQGKIAKHGCCSRMCHRLADRPPSYSFSIVARHAGFPESTTALYSHQEDPRERGTDRWTARRERERPVAARGSSDRFGVRRNENEERNAATERARPSG